MAKLLQYNSCRIKERIDTFLVHVPVYNSYIKIENRIILLHQIILNCRNAVMGCRKHNRIYMESKEHLEKKDILVYY